MDLAKHLGLLDHGHLADLVHDPRIVELLFAVTRQRRTKIDRGQLILDVLGGPAAILDDPEKRRQLILTLTERDEERLREALDVKDLYAMKLRAERRTKLYAFFEVEEPARAETEALPQTRAVSARYGLFPHQNTALLACLRFVETPGGRVMLHMPTGAGKTRTAMHLICRHLNRRRAGIVVWLVAGLELCEQAACEFERAWELHGSRPLPIIRIWSGRTGVDATSFEAVCSSSTLLSPSDYERRWPLQLDDAVIVASLDSLSSLSQTWEPSELLRRAERVSLVVFDEAHRAAAPTYKLAIERIGSRAGLLGLSATPGRRHHGAESGADSELVALFGQNKVELTIPGYTSPVEGLIEMGYLARLTHNQLEIANHSTSPSKLQAIADRLSKAFDIDNESLDLLGLDATRNLQIVDRVEFLVREKGHKRAIVFAPSVVSSNLIANLLNARGVVAFSIHAKTPSSERERIVTKYIANSDEPVVLCNFGVLTAGFDAPKTSAVVIARPTKSIVLLNQMAGRALRGRLVNGNDEATLVTVVDTSIPELVDVAKQFHAFDDAWRHPDTELD